jgi:S-DNA-T family DNA segregation ATPase FtsK/SpoIIIE
MAKTTKKEPLDKKNNSKAKEESKPVLTKQHKIVLGSL